MEMTPHEQNFYMQQQQQQQPQQPTPMFNQGQPQQSYPHVNQQMQRSQYHYPQMRMGYGMGYPRPHFQNENMSVNRNMLPPPNVPEQNVSLSNNMFSMNSSLRRMNNQSHMYMNNNSQQSGQMSSMGPWEQALNEPYSPYNHYPGTPSPQLHNQNLSLPHTQNMQRNQNSQMSHNPNSQITNTPMSHNPTTPLAHNQNTPINHNQYSGLENAISNYQTTVSPSITRPHTVSVNSTFGNNVSMQNMLRPQNIPGSNGLPGSRHPPQYSEGLMKRLAEPSGGTDYENINDDLNRKKCMRDMKGNTGIPGCSTNENTRTGSNFNLTKLDPIKEEERKDNVKEGKKMTKNITDSTLNIKNEELDGNGKCDSTETIPPGLLDTVEDFELITKSLMEKPFNPFRELNASSPSEQDILPQIPSICKSPVPQTSESDENTSVNEPIHELHNLESMSISNKNSPSDSKSPNQSSAVTTSTSGSQYCSLPLSIQNIYNQHVSDQDEQRNADTTVTNIGYSKDGDSSPGSNCDTTQSCDKLAKYPSCPSDFTGNNMPTFNFEFDTDLNVFLPNYSNKPSERNMTYCERLLGNHEEKGENTNEQSDLTNMLPLSGSNSDINNKAKASNIRKGRNKSDGDFGKPTTKRNKGTVKKGSRKSPYDCGTKNTKKVVNSSENKSSSDETSASSTSTTTYISSPEPEKIANYKLYFENSNNYTFHKYLRQLTSEAEKGDLNQTYPHPLKKLQNCEKVFLQQLSTPVMDSWIFDSLTPGVKNDKDIDLKYMTKRKITIYEDIPSDSIYEFIERSPTQPFRYLCPDTDRTQEPSQRLVALLQTNK